MTTTQCRDAMRAIMTGDGCVFPASVHDPISARIAEDLGYETGMFAGSVASLTVLGAPDLIVLTLSEFADQARRICRAGALPLIVDADHGYGNALNVKRTVEELENAGVSMLTIEDTVLPKPFDAAGTTLIPINEGVGKMKAAIAGRADENLVVLGRTSAVSINGIDDTIDRSKAYLDAGVDGMMLVGVKTREHIERVAKELDAPVMLGGVPQDLLDKTYLASCGVRVCLTGHQPFRAATQAIYETLKALRDGTPGSELKGLASSELMQQVTRGDDYDAWLQEFMKSD